MSKKAKTDGFTIIECVIAMVLMVVAFMGIFSLLTVCLRTEVISREMATANSLSRSKIEELKNSERVVGGSLTSNVDGFFDSPNSKYTRRWQVSADTMGTQTVTVAMLPNVTTKAMPEIKLTTRMK
jgi:Tfp pilus assembly protein PilV